MSLNNNEFDREPMLIHLNSNFADVKLNNLSSDVGFYFQNIEANSQVHIYLRVLDVVIPYSFYQINSSNNFLVVQNAQGNNSYITIPQGNYNVYQLITELKTQFQNNYLDMNVHYNEITNKLIFTLKHLGGPYAEFRFMNTSTCLKILGFDNTNPSSVLQVLTSTNTINLQPTNYIMIHTNLYTSYINKSQSSNLQNMFISIPINTPPNSLIVFQPSSNSAINTYDNLFNTIFFQLTDEYGNKIDLNGQDWSITLELLFYDFVNDGK